jgi:WD40 repeat protein/serine/threonine protein kinase
VLSVVKKSSLNMNQPRVDVSGDAVGQLGEFRLLREIGRGGMGIVYEALQTSLGRRVAVKVLTAAGAMDPRQIQRFQVEVLAAAALNHPNIVGVHSVGCERGVHFYAMELIEGRSLADLIRELRAIDGLEAVDPSGSERADTESTLQWILRRAQEAEPSTDGGDGNRVRWRSAAALGIQAALALEHAHQHGVLHRDIKPSNLLIDLQGKLWVADFGVARIQGDSRLTETGDLVGTTRYMSPEQALGQRGLIDARADVYALGTTLYELLTLRPAFAGDDPAELLGRIAREEPKAPRRIDPTIPADLETIVLKAMAKEPATRYVTAQELADDLGRHLSGERIRARPPSPVARLRSWTRRHRRLASAAMIVALAALVLVAFGAWSRSRQRGLTSELDQQKNRLLAQQSGRRLAEQNLDKLEHEIRLRARSSSIALLRQAVMYLDSGQAEQARENLRAVEAMDKAGARDFVSRYLLRLANLPQRDLLAYSGHKALVNSIAMSPDGKLVASGDGTGEIRIWTLATGEPIAVLKGRVFPWRELHFGPTGRLLASVGNLAADGQNGMEIWSGDPGSRLTSVGLGGRDLRALGFSADGGRFVIWLRPTSPGDTQEIHVYELSPSASQPVLRQTMVLDGHPAFTRYGRSLAIQSPGGIVSALDVVNGSRIWADRAPSPRLKWAVFSADGTRLACEAPPLGVVIRDAATGREITRFKEYDPEPERPYLFSSDGSTLLTTNKPGHVSLHDLSARPAAPRVLRADAVERHSFAWPYAAFSGDGTKMALSVDGQPGGAGPLGVWEVASGRQLAIYPGNREHSEGYIFTPDGRSVLLMSGFSVKRWWPDAGTDRSESLLGHTDEAWAVAFSPDGRWLASGSDDSDERQTIKLWDTATGVEVRGWFAGMGTVSKLVFSPDGKVLASSHLANSENIRLWDPAKGEPITTLSGHTRMARAVSFSPDGRFLASCDRDNPDTGPGTIRLWDMHADYREKVLTERIQGFFWDVAFSPDGSILAAAGDGETALWWVRTGEKLPPVSGRNGCRVTFSPHGAVVATVDHSGKVTLSDFSTHGERTVLSAASDLRHLAFSPDGAILAAAGNSGLIHLYDTLTGQELLTLEGHTAVIHDLAFSPDGSSLASCSHDGEVKIWRARLPQTRQRGE